MASGNRSQLARLSDWQDCWSVGCLVCSIVRWLIRYLVLKKKPSLHALKRAAEKCQE